MMGNIKLFAQVGRDVVACLNEAMERQGLDMRVSALVCYSYFHTSLNNNKAVVVCIGKNSSLTSARVKA